jgi:hypothetical protein
LTNAKGLPLRNIRFSVVSGMEGSDFGAAIRGGIVPFNQKKTFALIAKV